MYQMFVAATVSFGFVILGGSPVLAQATMSTEQDRTVRPADTIIWKDDTGEHVLRFGSTGGGKDNTELVKASDVEQVLSFKPELVDGDSAGEKVGTPMAEATVQDAAASGVMKFDFTCDVHPGGMRSEPFVIAASDGTPPRTLTITAANRNWIMTIDGGPQLQVDEPGVPPGTP